MRLVTACGVGRDLGYCVGESLDGCAKGVGNESLEARAVVAGNRPSKEAVDLVPAVRCGSGPVPYDVHVRP